MKIFFRELKASLKSLLIWSVIVILFALVGFSKFSAYYQKPEMLAILNSMPKALIDAFNMSSFNLTTLNGFYGVMVTFYALILAIAAVMWGSTIISKEERDKTVEFSLTLPVTRSTLITAKTAATTVDCIVLLLVTWGFTLVGAQNYAPDATFYRFVAISALAFFIIQMIFLALGIFLGCAMKKYKQAGGLAIAILLGTYFASVISGLSKNMEFLKYFSPFKYFDPFIMQNESRLEVSYVLLSVAIIAVCMAGAYFTYKKRDLYI